MYIFVDLVQTHGLYHDQKTSLNQMNLVAMTVAINSYQQVRSNHFSYHTTAINHKQK